MAIKVNGTTVIDDSRALKNIASLDAATATAIGAAGVGGYAPTAAPTTGNNYEICWPCSIAENAYNWYSNVYSLSPGPSRNSYNENGGPVSFSLLALTDGAATFRATMRSPGGYYIYFRVMKNGVQVSESSTYSGTDANYDINSSFSAGDQIQMQFRSASYGASIILSNAVVLSGVQARGALVVT